MHAYSLAALRISRILQLTHLVNRHKYNTLTGLVYISVYLYTEAP